MLVCVGIQIQITCEFRINEVLRLILDDAADMYVPRLNGHDCSTVFKPCRMEFEKSQASPLSIYFSIYFRSLVPHTSIAKVG
jgi:hypothetical protein